MTTELEYTSHVGIEHRKKFAQFFTPTKIADFMAAWVLNNRCNEVDILEPAFGLGAFTKALCKIRSNIRIDGYDVDKAIYTYAKDIFEKGEVPVSLYNEDYLTASWTTKYDGIICNPPYLKFHDYDNATLVPLVNNKLGIRLNGFTNIYTLFLLKSVYQLREKGRLAYIIPSEFLNSDYGVEVKRTLLRSGVLRHVIVVDFNQCAFNDALTTACVLLCEKGTNADVIHFSNIHNIADLNSSLTTHTTFTLCELNPEVKWKHYYESSKSSKYDHLVPFSTFAKVTRGIATGANDYFTFKASKIDMYSIPDECLLPCVCHAVDVKDSVFTLDDFESLVRADKAVFLFNGEAKITDTHVKKYLHLGVNSKINKRYLTASRSPWYAIEKRKPSPIWVSVFNRNGLRFIRNKANVYNLTTFHCIYNDGEIDTDVLFAYLLTDVAKEIFLDNSRQYGNGLVKFEPNDLNKGMMFDLRMLRDDEKKIISTISEKLYLYRSANIQLINLLDTFFRDKYTSDSFSLDSYEEKLNRILASPELDNSRGQRVKRIKQLNFLDLFDEYSTSSIVENNIVCEESAVYGETLSAKSTLLNQNKSKHLLVCLVKNDIVKQYENHTAKVYYTGKRFPATIVLNKLFFFMPYRKGKGIRDLYYIRVARIGSKHEVHSDADPNDIRLVFEIEFVKQLFPDYKPIRLAIWETFTDTKLEKIMDL